MLLNYLNKKNKDPSWEMVRKIEWKREAMENLDTTSFNHVRRSTSQLANWLENREVSSKLDDQGLSIGANKKEQGWWKELLSQLISCAQLLVPWGDEDQSSS